jgi:hypothetical protein
MFWTFQVHGIQISIEFWLIKVLWFLIQILFWIWKVPIRKNVRYLIPYKSIFYFLIFWSWEDIFWTVTNLNQFETFKLNENWHCSRARPTNRSLLLCPTSRPLQRRWPPPAPDAGDRACPPRAPCVPPPSLPLAMASIARLFKPPLRPLSSFFPPRTELLYPLFFHNKVPKSLTTHLGDILSDPASGAPELPPPLLPPSDVSCFSADFLQFNPLLTPSFGWRRGRNTPPPPLLARELPPTRIIVTAEQIRRLHIVELLRWVSGPLTMPSGFPLHRSSMWWGPNGTTTASEGVAAMPPWVATARWLCWARARLATLAWARPPPAGCLVLLARECSRPLDSAAL